MIRAMIVTAASVVLIAGASTPDMVVERNIPYATVAGVEPSLTSLDVYAASDAKKTPVLVYVHGGGWTRGDKAHVFEKPAGFVAAGYVFVSINYRLAPAVGFPTYVEDVAKAIAWVRTHIGDHGGDPDRIFLMGHSAGAHLVALVAVDGQYLKAEGESLEAVKGVVSLDSAGYDIVGRMKAGTGPRGEKLYRSAFTNDPDVWTQASPITHIAKGKDIPPYLLIHAGLRQIARVQAHQFADALHAAGVQAEVVAAPDKNHTTLNQELGAPGDGPTKAVLSFLNGIAGSP